MRGRNRIWLFGLLLVAAYLVFRHVAVSDVHYVWLRQLGASVLFWRPVLSQLFTGVIGGSIFAAATYGNLRLALPALAAPVTANPGRVWHVPEGAPWRLPGSLLRAAPVWIGLAVGAVAGWMLSAQWPTIEYFLHATPFPLTDPQFHRNVAFFVFTLPMLHLVYTVAAVLLWLAGLTAGVVYWAAGWLQAIEGRPTLHPQARRHLGMLLAGFLFLKAFGYRLDAWNVDYSTRGFVFGAGWVDVHAALPVFWLLSALALAAAAGALATALGMGWRWLLTGVGGLAATSLLLGSLLPAVLESVVVKPSQYNLEQPYIQRNITMTRAAFGLNAISLEPFPVQADLTANDLKAFRATFRNIRLWDGPIAGPAFQQLQGLRSYYSFDPANVDRYTVNGEYRQVLISAREINYNALPSETWVNRHINFTHGYGAVLIPSSQVGADGVPDFWLKDINNVSSVGIKLTQPAIYYGEQTNVYALVDGRQASFDYPSGSQDVYSTYQGPGGIPIGGFWQRLAFSLWANSYNPMLTSDVTAKTRAMIYRSLSQRLPRMLGAPFLYYGNHPYLVVADGQLYWMVNAYTESANYPYATPYTPPASGSAVSVGPSASAGEGTRNASGTASSTAASLSALSTPSAGPSAVAPGVNYVRNAVKVTVNAYTGAVRFYVVDPSDPIIRTIGKIFPGMLQPLSAMPTALQQHMRYPEDLFTAQAQMYTVYHMTDPQVFYNHEDQWRVARQIIGQQASPVQPYYVIMQFPNIRAPQFVLMEPFTPVGAGRDNMVAWLAAFSDGTRYGKLTAYEFPKRQTVFGPLQIEAQINQDPTVADILALWSQGGSKVYRGNMLTIPIRNSFLYVEPLYQEATATQLPALRRVIVDYDGQKIAVGDTLDQALVQIFGKLPWSSLNAGALSGTITAASVGGASSGTPASPAGTGAAVLPAQAAAAQATLRQAQTLFQQADAALRQGNFTTYAQDIDQLGQLLGRALGSSTAASTGSAGTAPTPGPGAAATQAFGATGGGTGGTTSATGS